MQKQNKAMAVVKGEGLENRIFIVRGCRVMLDADLAAIYRVSTKRLNQQVNRNKKRFPDDFMFQLTPSEYENLRLQFATSSLEAKKNGYGGRRYSPYVFTEHGAVMLASVLNSRIAIEASILVVRAFVRLRSLLAAHKELARKIEMMERKYDKRFILVFDVLNKLTKPALPESAETEEVPFGFQPSWPPKQRKKNLRRKWRTA